VASRVSFVEALYWLVSTQTDSSPRRLGWRTALPSGCRPHHRRALRHRRDPLHIPGHHDRPSYRLPGLLRRVLASAMRYASEYGSIRYFTCTQRVMSLFAFSSSRVLQNLYGLLYTPSWDACGTCCCRGRRGLLDCEPPHFIHVVLPVCRSPFIMQPLMSLLCLGADRAIPHCPAHP